MIKDTAAGPHTFNVQATNQAEVKETAGPPSASWSSVEPQHDLCGTISSNTTIGPDYASRYVIICSTTVAATATLIAQPGTIIKFDNATKLSVDGTLNAVGTASEPITFTSINDNSAGGATGNGSPAVSEWSGIEVLGTQSSVDMQHVSIAYSFDGLRVEGSEAPVTFSDDAVGNVAFRGVEVAKAKAGATFSDDVIEDAGYEGIEVRESGVTSVTGSTVSAAGYAIEAERPAGPVTVTGNSVAQVANAIYGGERGIAVRENEAGEAVKVAHNTLVTLAGAAIEVDSPSLDFAELATNKISGPGSTRLVLVEGTVGVSQTLGPEPFAWGIGLQQGPLEVPAGVMLTVAPGTVLKAGAERSCEDPGDCFDLYGAESKLVVHGSLDAVGTASEPITFTSINDSSVGGRTGNGTPEAGEWPGIEETGTSAVLDLADVSVRYADTALNVSTGTAAIRGSFEAEHDLNGLQACIWGGGCSLDAAYTYWGSPSGPGSSGGTDAACGAVTTTPYLTSATGEETATESSVFAPGDCGSGTTPPQELTTAEAGAAITVDGLESLCREDHEEAACEVVRQYEKCMSAATTLAQQSAPYSFSDDAQDAASAGASFIAKSEKAVVSSLASAASFGLELIGVASTIHDIAVAYNTCDP